MFRHDLRLQDHPALNLALESSRTLSFAIKKPQSFEEKGVWRQKFWLESVQELRGKLQQKGHELYLVSDDEIFSDFDCVFMTKEHAFYEINEEKRLKKTITLQVAELYEKLDVTKLPSQFTPFRKYVEKTQSPLAPFKEPDFSRTQACEKLSQRSLKWPDLPLKIPHPQTSFPFCGGEEQAHRRIQEYFFETQNVLSYKKTRNQMRGTQGSTKFSAWLALGTISPRQVYAELKRFERLERANESTYWVFFELLWREFFRWMCQRYGKKFFALSGLKKDPPEFVHDVRKIEAWKNGETGEAIVDACSKELVQTGFLSNRGRQIAASYFVNELGQDWRIGAAFFEKHLIDYDVYSNWGNWMYLAGVGFDPRPKRWFNPKKQADQYDPDGSFRELWSS